MNPFSETNKMRRIPPTAARELPSITLHQQPRRRHRRGKRQTPFYSPSTANRLALFFTLYVFGNMMLLLCTPDLSSSGTRGVAMAMNRHEKEEVEIPVMNQPATPRSSRSGRRQSRMQQSFPASIDKHDVEVIPHPALIYNKTLPINDVSQTLVVPKFWKPPVHLDGGLLTNATAKFVGSFWQERYPTIFVSIASYRDPDCINTIESIYSRAALPERIRTVVVEQLRDEDIRCTQPTIPCEEDPQQVLCRYSHLISSYKFDARLAVGPTFARHIAHRHYRGEYFAMQVDSHVRFSQGYDQDLIQQWQSAHNEMAVLSTYLLDLNGAITPDTHESTKTSRALLCNVYWEGPILKNGQQAARPVAIKGTPTIHPFWAAGFSFARGHFVTQVPYDGYLPMVFQGEEISMAVRAFTFGYDFYAPERNVCFHMYALSKNRQRRLEVPLFSENRKPYKGLEEQALKRLTSIIRLNREPVEDYVQVEEKLYGLGSARSPETFYKTFGVHRESQSMENHLCWFVGENMQKRFLPHLREDGMGIDYDALNYSFQDPAPGQP